MIHTFAMIGLVLSVALFVYIATKPDMFRIRRAEDIKASPDRIFALINDFHNWNAWSPYEKTDAEMKRKLSGKSRGKGAVYEWASNNNKSFTGRMEIIESSPSSKIAIRLDLAEPLKIRSIVEFTLEANDDATRVVWDMHGFIPYLGKMIGLFCGRDNKVGKDFEEGLINLKSIAER
ncbi:MAG: SRPBCC family protein [Methylobacter sp.]